jgi:hypothetical protein
MTQTTLRSPNLSASNWGIHSAEAQVGAQRAVFEVDNRHHSKQRRSAFYAEGMLTQRQECTPAVHVLDETNG